MEKKPGILTSKFKIATLGLAAGAAGTALGYFGIPHFIAFNAAAAPAILGATFGSLSPLWHKLSSRPVKKGAFYFPRVDILLKVAAMMPSPMGMPPWQKALALSPLVAAAIGASEPQPDTNRIGQNNGPVVVAVDNGWASAAHWEQGVMPRLNGLIDLAESKGRPVILLPAAAGAETKESYGQPIDAASARSLAMDIKPHPWPTDHAAQIKAIENLAPDVLRTASLAWLSDGLETSDADAWLKTIGRFASSDMFNGYSADPYLISPGETSSEDMAVKVRRLGKEKDAQVTLTGFDEAGHALFQKQAVLKAGEAEATVHVDASPNLTRVEIDGEKTAGATLLVDEKWRQRSVGLIDTGISEKLKNGAHFIESAIQPFTDLHEGKLGEILKLPVSVIILTDDVTLLDQDRKNLDQWIDEKGGMLLRFAGPNLAAQPNDDLLPVKLRSGKKTVTGDLSGGSAGQIAKFLESSPFSGITVPDDAKVYTLMLEDQGSENLTAETWASLDNGMPLITSAQHGKGRIVLVHTTANTDWSDIPLSAEFYLQIMHAIVAQSTGVSNQIRLNHSLPPLSSLDAQGRLGPAAHSAKALTGDALSAGAVDATHPPGFYGNNAVRMAMNIGGAAQFTPLRPPPAQTRVMAYTNKGEIDYGTIAFVLMAALAMADLGVRVSQNLKTSSTRPAQNRRTLKL